MSHQHKTKEKFLEAINELSSEALKELVQDIRSQTKIGLMNSVEAHDRINKISCVLMKRDIEKMNKIERTRL